jgi:hypothetical protein
LPKLVLPKFRGEITQWRTFWDSFNSAIHTNSYLFNIDKFNHLNSLLEVQVACVAVALFYCRFWGFLNKWRVLKTYNKIKRLLRRLRYKLRERYKGSPYQRTIIRQQSQYYINALETHSTLYQHMWMNYSKYQHVQVKGPPNYAFFMLSFANLEV